MAEAAIQARMSTISASTNSSNQLQQRSIAHPQSQQRASFQRAMSGQQGDVQVVVAPRVPALHVQHRRKTLRARLSYSAEQWGAIYRLLFTAFPFFGILMVFDLLLATGAFAAAIVPATLNYYANSGGYTSLVLWSVRIYSTMYCTVH